MAKICKRGVIGRKVENRDGVEEDVVRRLNYEYLGGC
jgi:hypothetical protein